MNDFESGARKLIPAVLVYARSAGRILMVHRNAADRPGDFHAGKWNGLGGKLEPGESPLEAARRELAEESGLEVRESDLRNLGWLLFPDFKPHRSEDWLCFVFVLDLPDSWAGKTLSGPEGDLHWVPEADVPALNVWPGDRQFLPHVLKREAFHGTLWYRDGQVARAQIERLAVDPSSL